MYTISYENPGGYGLKLRITGCTLPSSFEFRSKGMQGTMDLRAGKLIGKSKKSSGV